MRTERVRNLQSEFGATIIFVAAVILPVLFFLFSLTFDIAHYFTQRRNAQMIIDEAALYAHRYLPYTTAAASAAEGYLSRYGALAEHVAMEITPDTVALQYSDEVNLTFASYFGAGIDVPMHAYTRTQGTPYDVFLLMDTASYLSPQIPYGTAWGSDPAAQFFDTVYPIQHDADDDGVPELIDPVIATQQCFNPIFSSLKRAAIRTYEYLSSFQLNSVGVAVYPASGNFFDLVRPVAASPTSGEVSDVAFPQYAGGYIRPDYCAAAANYEVNFPAYRVPTSSTGMEGLWTPASGAPSIVEPVTYLYNTDYAPYLSIQELLWSQVARGNTNYAPNTPRVLEGIRAQIVGAQAREERKGLVNRAVKSAVLLAGDLPWYESERFILPNGSISANVTNALRVQLANLRSDAVNYDMHLVLYYVVFRHAGNQSYFSEGTAALEALFDEYNESEENGGKFSLHVLYGDSLDVLTRDLTSLIALDKRGSVLAR